MKKFLSVATFAALCCMGLMTTTTMTSCSDDDSTDNGPALEEMIKFDGLNVIAQSDGTILIDGTVTSNTKIKSLVLSSDEEGKNVIVDLLKSGDQTKAKAIDEAGEKQKTFTLSIPTTKVDVQTLYLFGKTRGEKKTASKISEEKEYIIGASGSAKGSYLSIEKGEQYTYDVAQTTSAEVISVDGDNDKTVAALKPASGAKNSTIASKAGKVALFQNGSKASQVSKDGVIITASGCICKIVDFVNDASGDAKVKTITIRSGLGAINKVDVSAFTFSK